MTNLVRMLVDDHGSVEPRERQTGGATATAQPGSHEPNATDAGAVEPSLASPSRQAAPTPYADQRELIDDWLDAIRARLRIAANHLAILSKDPHADQVWPDELHVAERAIDLRTQATLAAATEFPIVRLAQRFGLGAVAQRVLWALIAHELCPVARYLARELATETVTDLTTDVLRRVAVGTARGRDAWSMFEPDGVLRRYGFIEHTDTSVTAPDHRRTWRVSPRVLALVHEQLGLDSALAAIATIDAREHRADQLEYSAGVLDATRAAVATETLVIVHGKSGTGRCSLLLTAAAELGMRCLVIDGRAIAQEVEPARRQLRSLAFEAKLLGLTPLIVDLDALESNGDAVTDRLALAERELEGRVLATSSRMIARRWLRAPILIEVSNISGTQRVKLWQRALPMVIASDADLLATLYPLVPAYVQAVGAAATANAGTGAMTEQIVTAGLRSVLDDRFAGLASRVKVTQTWDDVVLADGQVHAINDLIARVRERRLVHEDWGFADKLGRGLGVAALFSGAPGTGKTMIAGLVAQSLRIEAYQVDLSKVVSKWIGETEKNLATLFDAAEAGHALLLFDEADALFGKRTDVKSSNDRHANQEVNFLLQRIESFTGIAILTTNHETAIDDAFRRRLAVHVRFEIPDVAERECLWRAMIPASAPRTDDLPLAQLASSYIMSGGHIRNAVLRAAFFAADECGSIDPDRLTRGAQLEYEAMGKIAPSKL